MQIDVITIFPEFLRAPLSTSLVGQAIDNGTLELGLHDLRDWTTDRHRTVDDAPYGGGAGMVMRADVWLDCLRDVRGVDVADPNPPRTIILTPRGRPLTQELAAELASEARLVLCCGRYEGIDERVHDLAATDEISIGDYVLAGGEAAALVLIEAVARLVPGVLGNTDSAAHDSFSDGLLEHPQYTRPAEVAGQGIPGVLASGNHGAVDAWRHEQALALTKQRRPDLYEAWKAAHPDG